MHVLPISKPPMQQSMQLQPGLAQALTKAQNPEQTANWSSRHQ